MVEDPEDERFMDAEFLDQLAARCSEDESLPPVVAEAAEYMSQKVSKMNMNDDYKPYIMVRSK